MSRMSEKMRAVDAASKKAIAALKEACAAPPEDEAAAWEAAGGVGLGGGVSIRSAAELRRLRGWVGCRVARLDGGWPPKGSVVGYAPEAGSNPPLKVRWDNRKLAVREWPRVLRRLPS